MENKEKKYNFEFLFLRFLIFIAITCITIVLLLYFYSINNFEDNYHKIFTTSDDVTLISKSEALAATGDFIGGISNPIISVVTICALFFTIFLQRKEIEQSKNLIKEQYQEVRKQNFENTFFKLMDQHASTLEKLENREIKVQNPPRDAYKQRMLGIDNTYIPYRTEKHIDYLFSIVNNTNLIDARKLFLMKNDVHGHYFILVYQILKFIFLFGNNLLNDDQIEKSKLNDSIKNTPINFSEKIYSNILRAIIKEKFLTLLAINCATKEEDDQFYTYRLLIERYSFLEHFEANEKFNSQLSVCEKSIFNFFDKKAFGESEIYKKIIKSKNKSDIQEAKLEDSLF